MDKRVLLICSGGGHLVQMQRIAVAARTTGTLTLATVDAEQELKGDVYDAVVSLPDFNRQSPFAALMGIPKVFFKVLFLRPTHIISTGAAPGIIGIIAGRFVGARTLWIDSIANTRRLSVSGRIALRVSHQVFTQWPSLADGHKVLYCGKII